jgi:hypothetical protein
MDQEINEGVSYLKALKQSGGALSATGAAPARETSPEGSGSNGRVEISGERYQGAEKRRSHRYKCEGSAELREEGRDVRTWATFSDISLHGCYVEAQATYPMGTILHVKLEANDVRLETAGKVRVDYPHLGMGIAFVDMSEENQSHLRDLLGTISRPTVVMGPGIASSLPTHEPLGAVPLIADAAAAVQALIEFFESRQMLMREDFLRVLKKSQGGEIAR